MQLRSIPGSSPVFLANKPAVLKPVPVRRDPTDSLSLESMPPLGPSGISLPHGKETPVTREPPPPSEPTGWQPGQLLLEEPLPAPAGPPPGRVEVLPDRMPLPEADSWKMDMWQHFEQGETRLREYYPQAERLMIRHQGVNFMAYRVGATGAPDGREGREIPSSVLPALEKAGELGYQGRTGQCFGVSNNMVLDGQARDLVAFRSNLKENLRGTTGVHYVAGMPTNGQGYALVDGTWPVSDEAERDQGWPQAVLILADSQFHAMAAASILYGAPPEVEQPDPRFR